MADKDISRRRFLGGAGVAAASVGALAVGGQAVAFGITGDAGHIRPPGAKDEADFSARCIRCGKCVQACPYESIKPVRSLLDSATGTPYIEARSRACRMCADVPCVPVCPTGALRDVEEPEQIKMGYAVILEDLCIAYAGMRCEVCYRACPLIDQAITIDYREREDDAIHLIFAPVIHDDICTGCGWCVERCVTDTPSIAIVRTLEEAEAMREEHRNMEKVRNY